MRAVIQSVLEASVKVEGKVVGSINKGYMILFGAAAGDTDADCIRLCEKISKLRIFKDENGKTNLAIDDIGGDILSISQFTLLADCHHGNRPAFINAAPPDEARRLYDLFCQKLGELIKGMVERGIFGEHMEVSLINDGPFTIVLDCKNGVIL